MKKHAATPPTFKTRDGKDNGYVGHCKCGWATTRRYTTSGDAYDATITDHIRMLAPAGRS